MESRHRYIDRKNYDSKTLIHKKKNKKILQQEFNLPVDAKTPLIGMIGRLVYQKGIDLVLDVLPDLVSTGAQLVLLGTGEKDYEQKLIEISKKYPQQIAVNIGYNEAQAHRIEAGADMFLMPSRFEPCGLNQLYSLRYGTIPVVSNVGGLFDSIINLDTQTQKDKTATGFVVDSATPGGLLDTLQQAIEVYNKPRIWNSMIRTGMQQDFSWEKSAGKYLQLYQYALDL